MGFINKQPQSNLCELLIKFIVSGHHSFRIVEEHWLKELIRFCNKDIALPVANTVRNWITNQFERAESEVMRCLKGVFGKLALTTEMWTSSSKKPYMVVTAHFLSSTGKLDSIILHFCHAPFPHSSANIQRYIKDVIMHYEIEDKITTITTDNAKNNKDLGNFTGDLSKVSNVRCIAHVIHLAVTSGLSLAKERVKRLRNLKRFLINSPRQDQKLIKQTEALGLKYLRPLIDAKTRWNSTLDMVKSALNLKPVICNLLAYASEFKEHSLTEDDWVLFGYLGETLLSYAKATTLLSGYKYATYSLFIPALDLIYRGISTAEVLIAEMPESVQVINSAIRAKLDSYLYVLKTPRAYLATLLDVRFKLENFESDKAELISKLKQAYENQKSMEISDDALVEDTSEVPSSLISELFGGNQSVDDEISSYLAYPVDRSADPIEFWIHKKDTFKVLSKLALGILVTPATSVPSEQAFSKSGDLVTKKRNKLSYKTVRKVMCLKSWILYVAGLTIAQLDTFKVHKAVHAIE